MLGFFSWRTLTNFSKLGQTAEHEKQAGPAKYMKMSFSVSSARIYLNVSVFKARIGNFIVAGVVGFFYVLRNFGRLPPIKSFTKSLIT